MLLNWQRAARIGTQLRCKARGKSFKFASQPAFAKTFLAGLTRASSSGPAFRNEENLRHIIVQDGLLAAIIPVCTENPIGVDDVTESPKLGE